MTTNSPYFPTALDALLALEQGINLIDADGYDVYETEVYGVLSNPNYETMLGRYPFYPTPETAHLLEPMAGDLVKVNGGHMHYLIDVVSGIDLDGDVIFVNNGQDYLDSDYELPKEERVSGFTIIQRAGKPFPAVVR